MPFESRVSLESQTTGFQCLALVVSMKFMQIQPAIARFQYVQVREVGRGLSSKQARKPKNGSACKTVLNKTENFCRPIAPGIILMQVVCFRTGSGTSQQFRFLSGWEKVCRDQSDDGNLSCRESSDSLGQPYGVFGGYLSRSEHCNSAPDQCVLFSPLMDGADQFCGCRYSKRNLDHPSYSCS